MRKESRELDVRVINGEIEEFSLDGQRYTGTVFVQTQNSLEAEFEVRDGFKDGLETNYYSNGTVETTYTFSEGLEEGLAREYFASGNLKSEMFFEKGTMLWSKSYNEEGQLTDRYNIDENSFEYRILQRYR